MPRWVMAQVGNLFFGDDSEALAPFIDMLLRAGDASRRAEVIGMTPAQRWAPFKPAKSAARLHSRTAHLFARYGWHRAGSAERNEGLIDEIDAAVRRAGFQLTDDELHGVVIAGAYWVDPPAQSVFSDEKALLALEDFTAFVSGYALALPPRPLVDEHPDSANRRFRAFQRRRNGYDVATRTPKVMIKRLPLAAQELLDAYADQLIYGTGSASTAIAETTAVALGRPLDPTFAQQIELTLATALMWRHIGDFPAGTDAGLHPLLGRRPDVDPELWEAAKNRVDNVRGLLLESPTTTDVFIGQAAAQLPVLGVVMDARSLQSLQRLDEYIHAFSVWVRSGAADDIEPPERIAAFDAHYRGTQQPVSTGAEVVSILSPSAMKVVANAGSLLARAKPIESAAVDLAVALGDRNLGPRCFRTLITATAWLNGQPSRMERTQTPHLSASQTNAEDRLLAPFATAKQRDAESLLDLGAAIADLVRFSQTLDHEQKSAEKRTPPGWWTQFHRHTLSAGIPTSRKLLSRLPEGSRRLLNQQARLFSDERVDDLTASARVLASALGRDGEIVCVRTLAVALSAGVVWVNRSKLSHGAPSDTLLGVEPSTSRDRYFCGRAQAQLEWGLQELLHTDTVVGV